MIGYDSAKFCQLQHAFFNPNGDLILFILGVKLLIKLGFLLAWGWIMRFDSWTPDLGSVVGEEGRQDFEDSDEWFARRRLRKLLVVTV